MEEREWLTHLREDIFASKDLSESCTEFRIYSHPSIKFGMPYAKLKLLRVVRRNNLLRN